MKWLEFLSLVAINQNKPQQCEEFCIRFSDNPSKALQEILSESVLESDASWVIAAIEKLKDTAPAFRKLYTMCYGSLAVIGGTPDGTE